MNLVEDFASLEEKLEIFRIHLSKLIFDSDTANHSAMLDNLFLSKIKA